MTTHDTPHATVEVTAQRDGTAYLHVDEMHSYAPGMAGVELDRDAALAVARDLLESAGVPVQVWPPCTGRTCTDALRKELGR